MIERANATENQKYLQCLHESYLEIYGNHVISHTHKQLVMFPTSVGIILITHARQTGNGCACTTALCMTQIDFQFANWSRKTCTHSANRWCSRHTYTYHTAGNFRGCHRLHNLNQFQTEGYAYK